MYNFTEIDGALNTRQHAMKIGKNIGINKTVRLINNLIYNYLLQFLDRHFEFRGLNLHHPPSFIKTSAFVFAVIA